VLHALRRFVPFSYSEYGITNPSRTRRSTEWRPSNRVGQFGGRWRAAIGELIVRRREAMHANQAIPRVLGWGLLVGVGMTAFFMIFAAAIPDPVNYCLNGPAVGLAWLWHAAGLPPQSEAAFAMPLVFGFAQWFVTGALLGLWRCRRRQL
jgi:hypothetical protein